MSAETIRPARQRGFLGFVERVGNLLPDPTIIFLYLIIILSWFRRSARGSGGAHRCPIRARKRPRAPSSRAAS